MGVAGSGRPSCVLSRGQLRGISPFRRPDQRRQRLLQTVPFASPQCSNRCVSRLTVPVGLQWCFLCPFSLRLVTWLRCAMGAFAFWVGGGLWAERLRRREGEWLVALEQGLGPLDFGGEILFIGQDHAVFGGHDLVRKPLDGVAGDGLILAGAEDQPNGGVHLRGPSALAQPGRILWKPSAFSSPQHIRQTLSGGSLSRPHAMNRMGKYATASRISLPAHPGLIYATVARELYLEDT